MFCCCLYKLVNASVLGMVDPNKIDISKIQATCEQILSKENEKKRIRRESDNQTKKQKVL